MIEDEKVAQGDIQKPRGRVWPGLKSVGGDFQPQQVTVLTPATQRRCTAFYKLF